MKKEKTQAKKNGSDKMQLSWTEDKDYACCRT